ncbi:unnamed protein product [Acanthosepion pharaonis]|uniref:Uncharacterized protein n=1 Tax=Acanthosepion pharaonis TaxID=158019 RepID=A0A812CV88_ACAPH|nr:unnamed protein product [Sepia pharaonis]
MIPLICLSLLSSFPLHTQHPSFIHLPPHTNLLLLLLLLPKTFFPASFHFHYNRWLEEELQGFFLIILDNRQTKFTTALEFQKQFFTLFVCLSVCLCPFFKSPFLNIMTSFTYFFLAVFFLVECQPLPISFCCCLISKSGLYLVCLSVLSSRILSLISLNPSFLSSLLICRISIILS